MLAAWWTVRACEQHDDHDLATRIACTRDVVLLSVDDPLVTVKFCKTRDVLRIR